MAFGSAEKASGDSAALQLSDNNKLYTGFVVQITSDLSY